MKLDVVRIGNSRGIRIPKRVLEECRMERSVRLRVKGTQIILEPIRKKIREGWAEAAKEAHAAGDDELLIPDVFLEDIGEERS